MDTESLIPREPRIAPSKASLRMDKQAAFCFLVFVALITFWSYYLLMADSGTVAPLPEWHHRRSEHLLNEEPNFTDRTANVIESDSDSDEVIDYDSSVSSESPQTPRTAPVQTRATTTVAASSPQPSTVPTMPVVNQLTTPRPETPIVFPSVGAPGLGTQNKTIFLIDSLRPQDGVLKLTPRQACAVESSAKNNPNWNVVLLTLNTHVLDAPGSNTSALREYPNIKIVNTTLESLVKGTIAEFWVVSGSLVKSKYPVVHYSDFLRLFVLYKYGGVYLDTDFIVLKSLDPIIPNFSVAETEYWVASAAMGFTTDGFGHFVIQHLVTEFMNTYNETIYAYNGPGLLTRFSQRICYTTATKNMTRDNCFDFEVLPSKLFYPIGYDAYAPLFNETQLEKTMEIVKDSYAMHAWNGLIGTARLKVGTKAALGAMAEQNCPKVYASCGEQF